MLSMAGYAVRAQDAESRLPNNGASLKSVKGKPTHLEVIGGEVLQANEAHGLRSAGAALEHAGALRASWQAAAAAPSEEAQQLCGRAARVCARAAAHRARRPALCQTLHKARTIQYIISLGGRLLRKYLPRLLRSCKAFFPMRVRPTRLPMQATGSLQPLQGSII